MWQSWMCAAHGSHITPRASQRGVSLVTTEELLLRMLCLRCHASTSLADYYHFFRHFSPYAGLGMNAEELKRNPVLTDWSVKDLNQGDDL